MSAFNDSHHHHHHHHHEMIAEFPKGYKTGCTSWSGVLPPHVVEQELLSKPPPTGIVVTLLLGRNPVLERAICGKFFASQLNYLIQPHELDILLVVAPSFNHRNQEQDGEEQFLSLSRLRQCLGLTDASLENQHSNERTWINLDGGSITTWEYQLPAKNAMSRPTRVFLATSNLVGTNTTTIPKKLRMDPPACQAPLDYILGTRWYVDDMLHLSLLQNYEYFIKLDPDVLFFNPLPFHLLHDMKVKGALFAHTAEYPPRAKSGSAQCAKDIVTAVQEFSHQHERIHASITTASIDSNTSLGWAGVPCTTSPQTVFRNADRYYTNFIVGRTDYFQSKQVRALGNFFAQYPNGFFRHRWTDQVFWSMALGLWVTEYDDPNHNQQVVADYTEFRCAPLRNCWLSSHDAKTFPDASNRCDNHGYFLHTKHVTRWEMLGNPQEEEEETFQSSLLAPRHTSPQTTHYHHDCRGLRWG
jgi:hypothetical protein